MAKVTDWPDQWIGDLEDGKLKDRGNSTGEPQNGTYFEAAGVRENRTSDVSRFEEVSAKIASELRNSTIDAAIQAICEIYPDDESEYATALDDAIAALRRMKEA